MHGHHVTASQPALHVMRQEPGPFHTPECAFAVSNEAVHLQITSALPEVLLDTGLHPAASDNGQWSVFFWMLIDSQKAIAKRHCKSNSTRTALIPDQKAVMQKDQQ